MAVDLQNLINDVMVQAGYPNHWIFGIVTDESKIPSPAFSIGLGTFGLIGASSNLISIMTHEELKFVVAHEVGHILHSHVLFNLAPSILKEIIGDRDFEDVKKFFALFEIFLMLTGKEGFVRKITKDKELDADRFAILLMRDKESAKSALLKLVNNDMDQVSHMCKIGDVQLPALTIRERIESIDRIFI